MREFVGANIIFLMLLCIIIGFSGCLKKANPGPRGPRGEAGDPGTEVGPRGPRGDKGKSGVGNFYFSEWLNPLEEGYVIKDVGVGSTNKNLHFWRIMARPLPMLTTKLYSSGFFVVYFKTKFDSNIYRLNYYSDTAQVTEWSGSNAGKETLFIFTSIKPESMYFRYFIIPEGLHLRKKDAYPDFDDYSAVCKYFDVEK